MYNNIPLTETKVTGGGRGKLEGLFNTYLEGLRKNTKALLRVVMCHSRHSHRVYQSEVVLCEQLHLGTVQNWRRQDRANSKQYGWMQRYINLSKPTDHVIHQQFDIQQFYVLPTLYLCVLCGSENKQRLFPYTALTDWFL